MERALEEFLAGEPLDIAPPLEDDQTLQDDGSQEDSQRRQRPSRFLAEIICFGSTGFR